MLYSELKAIHKDFEAYQCLRNYRFHDEKVDLRVEFSDGPPLQKSFGPKMIFDFDTLANALQSITSITHSSGQPLQEWLKSATVEFYSRIENVVNTWIDRVNKIDGVICISEHPYDKHDKHYLWFKEALRTSYSVGISRLKVQPFSYKEYSTGYGHDGTGFSVPRTLHYSVLMPTKEEAEILEQYDINYVIGESREVIKHETKRHYNCEAMKQK